MKTAIALLCASCATLPITANATPVTLTTQMNNYNGDGAYLALYVTDAQGAYAGSLWMAGGKAKYYKHLSDWYAYTAGNSAQIDGITGASISSGRKLEIKFDLNEALFDAGYQLHIDAAAEDMPESPSEIIIPLTRDGNGKAVRGRRYISSFTYDM